MNSPMMLASGIGVAVAGSALIPIGAIMLSIQAHPVTVYRPGGGVVGGGSSPEIEADHMLGSVFLCAGIAATAVSIPLIVLGSRHIAVSSGPNGSAGLTVRLAF